MLIKELNSTFEICFSYPKNYSSIAVTRIKSEMLLRLRRKCWKKLIVRVLRVHCKY